MQIGKDSVLFEFSYDPNGTIKKNVSDDSLNNKPGKDDLDLSELWERYGRRKLYDIDTCNCPTVEEVQQRPRELSPYQWAPGEKNRVYILSDTTGLKDALKNGFIFIDSTKMKKKKSISL